MSDQKGKQKVLAYYDQEAADYIKQYQKVYDKYPANLIRIKFIIERMKKNKVKTILDAGCGTCGPMIKLLKSGFKVKGFDFSKQMVEEGRKELKKSGYDPELIWVADLENQKGLPKEKFDAVIALGVFPHILDEKKALLNMKKMLKPGGLLFVEFRNDLFAAYTLNKYSLVFFLNRVIDLKTFPKRIRDEIINFYAERFQIDAPKKRKDGKISYTEILAKFRNPLNLGKELFVPCDFSVVDFHFYHYHALPPVFETKYPKEFRELSLQLEKINDWKGYLMASAYVVEARKIN